MVLDDGVGDLSVRDHEMVREDAVRRLGVHHCGQRVAHRGGRAVRVERHRAKRAGRVELAVIEEHPAAPRLHAGLHEAGPDDAAGPVAVIDAPAAVDGDDAAVVGLHQQAPTRARKWLTHEVRPQSAGTDEASAMAERGIEAQHRRLRWRDDDRDGHHGDGDERDAEAHDGFNAPQRSK